MSLSDTFTLSTALFQHYACCPDRYTVFLQSDAAATIYFTTHFVRLLFEGTIYLFGKP